MRRPVLHRRFNPSRVPLTLPVTAFARLPGLTFTRQAWSEQLHSDIENLKRKQDCDDLKRCATMILGTYGKRTIPSMLEVCAVGTTTCISECPIPAPQHKSGRPNWAYMLKNLHLPTPKMGTSPDLFYKKESQEKTLLHRPDFFLVRSPLDGAGSVLNCRAMYSVAGHLCTVIWVLSTSGFHCLIAQARKLQEIWTDGTPPITMRTEIQVMDPKGKVALGQYVVTWLSSSRWRDELEIANYKRLRVHDAKGYWQQSTLAFQPEIIFQLDSLLDFKTVLKIGTKTKPW
jgi:hypothetical protein